MAVRPCIALLFAVLALAATQPAVAATATGTASSALSVRLTLANPCAPTAHTPTTTAATTVDVACTDGVAPQVRSSDAAGVGIRALGVTDAGALRIALGDTSRATGAVTISVEY
jgi:hypothetical protein